MKRNRGSRLCTSALGRDGSAPGAHDAGLCGYSYSQRKDIRSTNMKRTVTTTLAAIVAVSGALLWAKPGDVKDKVKDPSSGPAKPSKEHPVSPLDFTLKS